MRKIVLPFSFVFILILTICGFVFHLSSVQVVAANSDEVYHEGDLVIDGEQTYLIENETLVIEGNIIVKDKAKLLVKNSSIFLKATYTNEYEIAVLNEAALEINNSTLDYLDREGHEFMLYIRTEHPGTMLSIRNSTIHFGINLSGPCIIVSSEIYGDGVLWRSYCASQLEMTDTIVRFITLSLKGNEPEEVILSGLKYPDVPDVHITTESGASIDIENCYLEQGWIVDAAEYDREAYSVRGLRNRLHIIVEDSDIERLWFWFGSDSHIKVENLHPMEVTEWNMHDAIGGSGFEYDVTFRNSSIKWYQLTFRGDAEVDNISGTEITLQEQALVYINNSQLEQYTSMTGTNDHLIIENSIITPRGGKLIFREGLGPWEPPPGGFNHYIEFHNTIMNAHMDIECQYTNMKGEVEFITKLDRVKWSFGDVEREYPVVVVDKDENPLPGVALDLLDSNGKSVWKGATDDDARTFPTIRFNKDNYTSEWRLVVVGKDISKMVGFLTNTPIIIPLPSDEIEIEAEPPQLITTIPEPPSEPIQTSEPKAAPSPSPDTTITPKPDPAPSPTHAPTPIVWLLVGIIGGIVIGGLVAYIFFKRKSA